MVFKDKFLIVLLLATVTVLEHSNGNNEFEMHSNRLQEANHPAEGASLKTSMETSSPQVKEASRFWYAVRGEADHFREESRDENGVVHGTYGYRTPAGIMRLVRYVADAKGFRAGISSNEPGVSKMEPSSVRLYKFSLSQRTQPNTRMRNPPLNVVSSPVRTQLWGSNAAESPPFRYNTNLYEDAIRYVPESAYAHGPRRSNTQKTGQNTLPFGSTVAKNEFLTSVNRKDSEYGTQNSHSYPKLQNVRTTPFKLTTPPTVLLDSGRLPPWKRISLLKKNPAAINAGVPTDIYSSQRIVSSNTLKENGEIIKEPGAKCEKTCASKLAGPGLNTTVEETNTNSYTSQSNIHEHLSHSFSIQEKLSAVRTVLHDYLSKDNTTLPQIIFAKKLLQFYDHNGILPPHLLPSSISPHSKRTDSEVKALLDRIAEERWQYERNQNKKPWRNYDGMRDIYQPEYPPPFQYPKRPFIQVLSPIAVSIPEEVPHEKGLMNAPISSAGNNVKEDPEKMQFISNAPYVAPEGVTDKNKPEIIESMSTPATKMDTENDAMRRFVLRHFLLGSYASDQGVMSSHVSNVEESVSDNGNSLPASSSEKDTLNSDVHTSETSPELTTPENAITLPKDSQLDSQLNSGVHCSQNSHNCISKTQTEDSEGSLSTNTTSLHVTSSLSPEQASSENSGAFFSAPPLHPQTASTVSRYWQDNSFLDQLPQHHDHRLFKIIRPERPLYDSRGQLVQPDAVPLHLHRFRPVKSSSPSRLGPFRFSIPRPVPPSSVIIPPKPPTIF